jgi:hypothetical protein
VTEKTALRLVDDLVQKLEHARSRANFDVDVLVGLDERELPVLINALKAYAGPAARALAKSPNP